MDPELGSLEWDLVAEGFERDAGAPSRTLDDTLKELIDDDPFATSTFGPVTKATPVVAGVDAYQEFMRGFYEGLLNYGTGTEPSYLNGHQYGTWLRMAKVVNPAPMPVPPVSSSVDGTAFIAEASGRLQKLEQEVGINGWASNLQEKHFGPINAKIANLSNQITTIIAQLADAKRQLAELTDIETTVREHKRLAGDEKWGSF